MGDLASRLGLEDIRVGRLLRMIRRHSPSPAAYCLPLGVESEPQLAPDDYPPALCPQCDGVHNPHPEDVDRVCPDCVERERLADRGRPSALTLMDRSLDRAARGNLMEHQPRCFDDGILSPNWQSNHHRRVHRDWESAVNRILMGWAYREVAKDFDCSVGLLHKKVMEARHWENN